MVVADAGQFGTVLDVLPANSAGTQVHIVGGVFVAVFDEVLAALRVGNVVGRVGIG